MRGPAVTPGYWRQPELTAQAFDAEGFYRLGDAVRLIDPERSDPRTEIRRHASARTSNSAMAPGSASVRCARSSSPRWRPLAQDVVIAGLDAEFVAALVIPDVERLRGAAGLAANTSLREHREATRACLRGCGTASRAHALRQSRQHALRAPCDDSCRSRRHSIVARSPTRGRSTSAQSCGIMRTSWPSCTRRRRAIASPSSIQRRRAEFLDRLSVSRSNDRCQGRAWQR